LMTNPGVGPVVSLTYRRHCRRSGSLPQIQVRRGGVWADELQVSIG
jgi:hypothetical protein